MEFDQQTPTEINLHNTLNEITKSCEKLITETQHDLQIFRKEQQSFKQKIWETVEENNSIGNKLESLKGQSMKNCFEHDDAAYREKLLEEAFKNLQQQNRIFENENNELRSVQKTSQKTIENLQHEIEKYREQLFNTAPPAETKQKYIAANRLLESAILKKKSELKVQTVTIDQLLKEKHELKEKVAELEKILDESKQTNIKSLKTIKELEEHIKSLLYHNKELQKSLNMSKVAISESMKREQKSLEKVQEAVTNAESALAERCEAVKREEILKEESKQMASTIGQVMDEAISKVESEMNDLRKMHGEKEKSLKNDIHKLVTDIQNYAKCNQMLFLRCKRFEQKNNEITNYNEELSEKLELLLKTLNEKNTQISYYEQIKQKYESLQRISREKDEAIRKMVAKNKDMKEKYHNVIDDLATQFQESESKKSDLNSRRDQDEE